MVCTCYRQRAETENTPIIAVPLEIALLSALQEHKTFSINMCSEMGGPTGNILCSLRFWAHFQWTVCGKAQIRFLKAPLPRWQLLCLSVSLCDPHICVALSHKHTVHSWAHSLSGSLQVDSSVVQDAATTNALMNSESENLAYNCLLFLSSSKQTNLYVKMKRGRCWGIHCNTVQIFSWKDGSWEAELMNICCDLLQYDDLKFLKLCCAVSEPCPGSTVTTFALLPHLVACHVV